MELLPGMEVALFLIATGLVVSCLLGTCAPTDGAGRLHFSSGLVALAPGAEYRPVEKGSNRVEHGVTLLQL